MRLTLASRFVLLTLAAVLLSTAAAFGADSHFEREVMAVLSQAGCNMGACHGNLNGKGGLKLSLRGEDAKFDLAVLTRKSTHRYVDRFSPDDSLLLQKASGRIAHGGGQRFAPDSQSYQILRDWIAAGAASSGKSLPKLTKLEVTPQTAFVKEDGPPVQIQAIAHFANGEQRNVTQLCTFELSNLLAEVSTQGVVQRRGLGETTVLVRFLSQQHAVRMAFIPKREKFVWKAPAPRTMVDEHVFNKLQKLTIQPADVCDDATFCRRVYLDLTGSLPTRVSAAEFIADTTPDKRERLVDALLTHPAFADFWALKWGDILRSEEKVLDPKGVDAFHGWIRDSIALGRRMDAFVRDLVATEGSTYAQPASNFYRVNREPTVRGETAARLFLGIRLQCAKCHSHPFDRWTMDDYYAWSALFARVDYKLVDNKRGDKLDLNEYNGEQIIVFKTNGEVTDPRSSVAVKPKFLGTPFDPATNTDRLSSLASWLTSPENPYFAKAQGNFVWYHLLGRGLVEPIDDVRSTNPAANPAALEFIAAEFVRQEFDLQSLVRLIANSQVYQLAAATNETNRDDNENFSRAYLRRLTAEQLVDAQALVLGNQPTFSCYRKGTRAVQLRGVQRGNDPQADGDRLLRSFGKNQRLLACECERSNDTTLKQAFVMLSSDTLENRLQSKESRPQQWADSSRTNAEIIQELYWTALGRPATSAEGSTAEAWLSAGSDRASAVFDLTWAVLNSKEFLFRH